MLFRSSTERGSAWQYLSDLTHACGAGLLEPLGLVGDTFHACGPLKAPRAELGQDVAVRKAALAALRLAQHLVRLPLPAHFTVVLALSDGYGAVIGSHLLSYNVFGPVVRTAAGLMAAAPIAQSSYAVATTAFRQATLPAQRMEISLPRGASGMSHAIYASAVDISRNRGRDRRFASALQWRVRGLGVVQTHAILPSEVAEAADDTL